MKRLFIFILVLFSSIMGINAITTVSNSAYYNWDNNLDDVTGNGFNLTNFGAILNNTGKINQAYDYRGTSGDYMRKTTAPPLTGSFAMGSWVFLAEEADGANKNIVMSRDLATSSNINYNFYISNANDFVTLGWYDGAFQNCFGVTNLVANTWYYVGATFNDTNNSVSIYINGVEDKTCTGATGTPTTAGTQDLWVGSDRNLGSWFSGTIDEVTIFNRGLDGQDYLDLYNSGAGFQYPYTPESAPAITNNIISVYDTNNISIQLNTSTNVNMSYVLNSVIETSICNDCNNSVLNITGVEGVNNITLISLDNNGQTNTTDNFIIDTIFPTITNNLLNLTSYDFISNFSCSDINIVSCNISIDGFNKNSSTNFTLNHNGNLIYTITAIDLAGNTLQDNNILFVNPFQNFYFTAINGTTINNFVFGGLSWTTFANIPTYNSIINLGSNNLTFSKLGFATTDIIFNVNTTSQINLTTNITDSKIVLQIFDESTKQLLTGLTTITLISTNGFNGTTTTGLLNISDINFISESYQVIASHNGFTTETVFFDYDNQQILNKDIYLINTSNADLGSITLKALNSNNQFISGAICSANEWFPSLSSFVSVAEGKTNINGETILNIDIGTEFYKFQCTKLGNTAMSNSQIIQTSGTILPILFTTGSEVFSGTFDNFKFNLTNVTETGTLQRFIYTFQNTNNVVTEGCLKFYDVNGLSKTLITENCTSSSFGQAQAVIETNNSFNLLVEALSINNNIETVHATKTFKNNQDISISLNQYHLDLILPLLFVLIGIIFGYVITPKNIYISQIGVFIAVWLSVLIVPSVISVSIASFISIIIGFMLWGSTKK